MTQSSQTDRARKCSWLKRGAFVCAAIFVINLLLGKGAIVFGWNLSFLLDGVSEFVLLLVTVTLFVIYTLMLEKERDTAETKSNN
jgi:hypothetical protein